MKATEIKLFEDFNKIDNTNKILKEIIKDAIVGINTINIESLNYQELSDLADMLIEPAGWGNCDSDLLYDRFKKVKLK